MDNNEHLLLFDGVCNLCIRLVNFIIKRDAVKKFKFAALQSPVGESILKTHNLYKKNLDTIIYVNNGSYYVKSTAVLHILKDLGGVWKIFYVFIIIPAPIRNLFYSLIAKVRYKIFGKRDVCLVPSNDIKDRFPD